MFSTTVVTLVISVYAVEILAVDESCVITNAKTEINNCCDLGFTDLAFTKIINQPEIYKLVNFCSSNCRSLPISGYCDTVTGGGGWLVVQRRMSNGSENFQRNWNDYEMGFGSLTGELWYGLRALHCLTSNGNWELRIDFTFSNGTKSFMHYNHFRVGPATDNYRLCISGFTGTTPDDPFSTYSINGEQFTTYDRDNDIWRGNCALNGHGGESGGWWHKQCNNINLNYNYNHTGRWGFMQLAGKWYDPKFAEMKIRPVNCEY